jgi:hypothetical protein
MRRAERVVFAFRPLGEARKPPLLAQRAHPVAAAGDDLVRIALVAHVPDQLVARRVEDRMDRHRQFDHPSEDPRCPPVRLTTSIVSCRNSSARLRRSASLSALQVGGPATRSMGVGVRLGTGPSGGLLEKSAVWEVTPHGTRSLSPTGREPGFVVPPGSGPAIARMAVCGGGTVPPPGSQAVVTPPRATQGAQVFGSGVSRLSSGRSGRPGRSPAKVSRSRPPESAAHPGPRSICPGSRSQAAPAAVREVFSSDISLSPQFSGA